MPWINHQINHLEIRKTKSDEIEGYSTIIFPENNEFQDTETSMELYLNTTKVGTKLKSKIKALATSERENDKRKKRE